MRDLKHLGMILASFSLVGVFAFATPALAEDVFKDVCSGAGASSTVCQSRTPAGQNPLYGPNGVITTAISIISIIVGIAAFIALLFGGLKFISSGSNPNDVVKARETIIYAIVGLIIAVLAQTIVQFFLKKIG